MFRALIFCLKYSLKSTAKMYIYLALASLFVLPLAFFRDHLESLQDERGIKSQAPPAQAPPGEVHSSSNFSLPFSIPLSNCIRIMGSTKDCQRCDTFYVDVADSDYGYCVMHGDISRVRAGNFDSILAKYSGLGMLELPMLDTNLSADYNSIEGILHRVNSGSISSNKAMQLMEDIEKNKWEKRYVQSGKYLKKISCKMHINASDIYSPELSNCVTANIGYISD